MSTVRRPPWLTVANAKATFLFVFGVAGVTFEMVHGDGHPNWPIVTLLGGFIGAPFFRPLSRRPPDEDGDDDNAG